MPGASRRRSEHAVEAPSQHPIAADEYDGEPDDERGDSPEEERSHTASEAQEGSQSLPYTPQRNVSGKKIVLRIVSLVIARLVR